MDSSLGAIALGFVFGLQHATDADHVVAVASIVSRTGRFASGALVGAFWGLGHTVTIAAAGMAIVLFITSPPTSASWTGSCSAASRGPRAAAVSRQPSASMKPAMASTRTPVTAISGV